MIKELPPSYFDVLDRSLDRLVSETDELQSQILMMAPGGSETGNGGDGDDGSTSEVSRSTDQLARIVVSCV